MESERAHKDRTALLPPLCLKTANTHTHEVLVLEMLYKPIPQFCSTWVLFYPLFPDTLPVV